MNSFLSKMSRRERVLAAIVVVTLVVLLLMALLQFITQKQALLRSQIVTKSSEIESLKVLAAERDLWETRDEWLDASQPPLENQSSAGVALLDQIKTLAEETGVMLENPAIGLPEMKPEYHAIPVTVETRSSWEALVKFLQALQAPGRFIAVESMEVKVDGSDKSKMHGSFRIARWYAPTGG